ncbi:DNA damage-regulated autophagy modulator protein 2 isoform X2 [Thrips palmi]|uniref:DNA damage-regulated autophagy modulator protein 2 isoform X2 n=1 Tax=Thrips palmi TaxID=161013 RepID=A0A6P8YY18_THRPL|nr:DNA damage-regulated autophagy modulator protein 2 isoform X2 [Thrips palmi]
MGVTNFTMLLTILVITLLLTITVSYGVSVKLGHVPLAFPYISETGNTQPESCIFSFGMNIASFLYAVAVYLRYRELVHFRAMSPESRISVPWNRFGLWLGSLSALGLCVVANFQVGKVPVPHYLGAMCCFVGGSAYFALQTWFSKRMCPQVSTKQMVVLRTALTVMSAVALVVCVASALVAIPQFDGTDQVDWRPEHKGYALHCVSTAAEWLVALLFVGSIVTYIPEMRAVSLSPPTFRILLLESVTTTKVAEKY